MSSFKFIHAADLHLDSPLTGLAAKSADYARRVEHASREAFGRLIKLTIDEGCAFLVISGDLFDGQWRDYRTGLFFAAQMAQLREAKIPVYLILGNHDAENRFVSRLQLSDNVTLLSAKKPQTVMLDSLGVAIHGQSFPARDVTTNLAASYPAPSMGMFNIGLLHTALAGHEGEHAKYAPCTVEQLTNHGYDYWALGHVHDFMFLHDAGSLTDPFIVYSGVLQGRHIRETGPKGAVLVSVENGAVASAELRPLDSVRWHHSIVDVATAASVNDVESLVRRSLEAAHREAGDRALAVRITLLGATELHTELVASRAEVKEILETSAAGISSSEEIWIEKTVINTTDVSRNSDFLEMDPTIAGRIRSLVQSRAMEPAFQARIAQIADEVKGKMPAGAWDDAFRDSLIADSAHSARDLALSVLEQGLEQSLRRGERN